MNTLETRTYLLFTILISTSPIVFAQTTPCTWNDTGLMTFSPRNITVPSTRLTAEKLLATGTGNISFSCPPDIEQVSVEISNTDAGTDAPGCHSPTGNDVLSPAPPNTKFCNPTITNINTNLNGDGTRPALLGYYITGDKRDGTIGPGRSYFSALVTVPLYGGYGIYDSPNSTGTYGADRPSYSNNASNALFKITLTAASPTTSRFFRETRYYGSARGTYIIEREKNCSITNPQTINVAMGSISSEQITQNQAPKRSFAINLNCPQGTRVSITAMDSNNTANRTNKLSLNNNAASGVAIQLEQENGQALYLGQAVSFAANTAGAVNIPFSARYVATGSIVPGSANATATFTLTYQ